jgi:hypothetical protein
MTGSGKLASFLPLHFVQNNFYTYVFLFHKKKLQYNNCLLASFPLPLIDKVLLWMLYQQ